MNKTLTFALLLSLSTAAYSCNKPELPATAPDDGDKTPAPVVEVRVNPDVEARMRLCPHVTGITSVTTREIAHGLTETDMSVTIAPWDMTDSVHPEDIYILCMDNRDESLELKVALPDNSGNVDAGWKRQNLTLMTDALGKAGETVLAMVNADFWNTTTIVPRGPVHFRGTVVRSEFDNQNKQQGASFVAVRSDGQLVIDYSASYLANAAIYPEMTGSGVLLVKDSLVVDNSRFTDTRNPRTAIGQTRDGYVYIVAIDGRRTGSDGVGYLDMARLFLGLGCVEAVNLDGGGSTQMLVRDPATLSYEIRNTPSDGTQRSVIDGWAIVRKD